MKKFHLFSILFFSLLAFDLTSQIITDESLPDEKRKKNKFPIDTVKTAKTEAYFGSNWAISNRVLKVNEGLFQQELGERINEKSLNTWSFGIGFRQYFKKPFSLDAGISLLQNGESYSYEEIDTNFHYQTTYTYIAMPIHFNYTTGNKLKLIAGVGITPQMFIRYKQDQQWKTKLNDEGENSIKTKTEKFNSFVISATIQAGVNYSTGKRTSLYFIPEYRLQLNSSYLPNSGFLHYSRVFGINFGLSYIIE